MLDATDTVVAPQNSCTDPIDSSGEHEPPVRHHTNPLKHFIEKIEEKKLKKKSKKKLPDFKVTAFPIPLQWIEAVREGEVYAEILCSAEFIEVCVPWSREKISSSTNRDTAFR